MTAYLLIGGPKDGEYTIVNDSIPTISTITVDENMSSRRHMYERRQITDNLAVYIHESLITGEDWISRVLDMYPAAARRTKFMYHSEKNLGEMKDGDFIRTDENGMLYWMKKNSDEHGPITKPKMNTLLCEILDGTENACAVLHESLASLERAHRGIADTGDFAPKNTNWPIQALYLCH